MRVLYYYLVRLISCDLQVHNQNDCCIENTNKYTCIPVVNKGDKCGTKLIFIQLDHEYLFLFL